MTLESKLFELTTLVDYGTYYLHNRMFKADELMPEEILKRMDGQDVIQYLLDDGWAEYILNHMEKKDVHNYLFGDGWNEHIFKNMHDVLDGIGTNNICRWLRDYLDVADILDAMGVDSYDVLCDMDSCTIKDYAREHFDADEIYDADDMLDSVPEYDIDRWIRCNRHIGEIGFDCDDVKDYVAENWNVGDVFDEEDIKTYVRENCDVNDWVCTDWI